MSNISMISSGEQQSAKADKRFKGAKVKTYELLYLEYVFTSINNLLLAPAVFRNAST